ncbi:MAG: hypothetical protein ACFB0B_06885 [Thermonemataceae bacterium]
MDTQEQQDIENIKPQRSFKWKKVLLQVVMDIIPVIIGILIALYIDGVKEAQQDAQMLQETVQGLMREFQENKGELEKAIASQTVLIDSLEYYIAVDSVTLIQVLDRTNGVWSADISNVSWQNYLGTSGISNLSFEGKSLLGKINAYHRNIIKKESELPAQIYQVENFKIGKKQRQLKQLTIMILNDIIGTEETTLQLYTQFEKLVKTKKHIH